MTKMNFNSNANLIMLDVFIEHKGQKKKVRMALDTGATYIMIPRKVATALNLGSSEFKIKTVTASGIESVPIIDLPIVRVGESETKNIKAIVHDLPAASYVDGLLGLSFLKKFNVHLNFKEGVLAIN